MTRVIRWTLPNDVGDTLDGLVPAPLSVEVRGATDLRRTYLDTFDWRVAATGGRLVVEKAARRRHLRWQPHDDEDFSVPCRRPPRRPSDFPAGFLRDFMATTLGVRALLPMAAATVHRIDLRITTDLGDVVALAAVETASSVDGEDPSGPEQRILRLEAVVDDGAWKTVAATLESALERAPDELHDWAAIRGRTPGDYRTAPRLESQPQMPAETALRSILAQLAEVVTDNVPGVLADHDIEFLHDLRVASRRARSALSQLREVLECPDLEDHLRWLGGVTGSCRDLDVWLVDIPAARAMLPARLAADLDPLEAHLQTARGRACRQVRRALRSPRFAALMRTWHRAANDPVPGPRAAEPIASVAADRIGRRYRKIVTRGSTLGVDPPAESLHRIRIDAKKLRYLLEFFEPVLHKEGIGNVIKELKGLQDLLGSFNDLDIQQRRLLAIADELKADPSVPAATLFALGRLQAVLEARQDEERLKFHDRFEVFASASVARTVDHLLELEDGQ